MTSSMGSVALSGSALLGGMAGKIDTDALIEALVAAKAAPQRQLQRQLSAQQTITSNLQEVNARLQAVSKAAQSITDVDFGKGTKATSSNSNVVANSSAGAVTGSSTFHVNQTAAAQVSAVAIGSDGIAVSDVTAEFKVGDTVIDLSGTDGSAAAVANAINKSDAGVRAAVVNTDSGQVLQFTAKTTGTEAAFSVTGLDGSVDTLVAARNAQIQVGELGSGGYTISSQSNTFTDAMPGVTFSVSSGAVGEDVTITVGNDADKAASQVKALIDALNSAKGGISTVTGKGGVLQGRSEVTSLSMELANVISSGVAGGKSLTEFGIDMNKDGVISFDAAKFTAAYNADSKGTIEAIQGSFAQPLRTIADGASAPVTGSISQSIDANKARQTDMTTQIAKWDDRLDVARDQLMAKYTAMQTALAKLQGQSDWLTSVFDAINGKKD